MMMRPEVLQDEFLKILESSFVKHKNTQEDDVLYLDEAQMFQLWNILGEELGIDLSLATEDQRRTLLNACTTGKPMRPKDFSSLLWLVYYSDIGYQ